MWPYYRFPNMAGPYGRSTSGHVVPANVVTFNGAYVTFNGVYVTYTP